jgi:hypothetical protein
VTGTDDDDEALTWAGARDPSHYETPKVAAPIPPRRSKAATSSAHPTDNDGVGPDGEGKNVEEVDDARPPMSSVVLVCLGVLGGIYGLYTIGWFISWQRLVYSDPVSLRLAAFSIQQVLAILAPPLWFGTTLYFTRKSKPAFRLLWLLIGALLLVPWSFTFGQ